MPFKPLYACDVYSGIDLYLNSEIFMHMDNAIVHPWLDKLTLFI